MKKRPFKKSRKLKPYQYKLRLHVPSEPKICLPPKAHLVYYDGEWHLFRSRWKSQYRTAPWIAAQVCGSTIPKLQKRLAKIYDRWRFGFAIKMGNEYVR